MLAARRKQLPAQGHRPCTLALIVYSEPMKVISVAFLLSIAMAAAAQAPDMVKIPAGPFTMGSNEGHEDERPAHTVTLAAFDSA